VSVIAIQGTKGSYSEEAVGVMFDDSAELLECADFAETFAAVVSGKADRAVVPLRNKIIGDIESAVTALQQTNLKILDQLMLEVRHVLAGTPDAEFADIESVRSHEEALRQCSKFIADNKFQAVTGADTASSVRRIVAEGDKKTAAIGSRRACEMYGGKILRENIADDAENITYFYLVGRH
jgi:prephenate dehydratase